jgi:hypothetical protein
MDCTPHPGVVASRARGARIVTAIAPQPSPWPRMTDAETTTDSRPYPVIRIRKYRSRGCDLRSSVRITRRSKSGGRLGTGAAMKRRSKLSIPSRGSISVTGISFLFQHAMEKLACPMQVRLGSILGHAQEPRHLAHSRAQPLIESQRRLVDLGERLNASCASHKPLTSSPLFTIVYKVTWLVPVAYPGHEVWLFYHRQLFQPGRNLTVLFHLDLRTDNPLGRRVQWNRPA